MTTKLAEHRHDGEQGLAMPDDTTQALLQQVKDLTLGVAQTLNANLADPETVVGLGVCAVQLTGRTTSVVLDSGGKPMSAGIRMASSVLATCLQDEKNPRVQALLNKALKLTEEALKVRSGEIISTRLH